MFPVNGLQNFVKSSFKDIFVKMMFWNTMIKKDIRATPLNLLQKRFVQRRLQDYVPEERNCFFSCVQYNDLNTINIKYIIIIQKLIKI